MMQRAYYTTPNEQNDVGTQGLINANYGISEEAMKARQKAMEESKPASATSYPQTLGVPGSAMANVNIRPGEILVTYKQTDKRGRATYTAGSVNTAEVFSSFAGMRFADIPQPVGRPTDMRFEVRKQFTAVGVAAIPYRYSEPTQKKAGISGSVGGSMSMPNTGLQQISTGDKILWDAPPTAGSVEERELAAAFKRNNPGYLYSAKTMTMPLNQGNFVALFEQSWRSLQRKIDENASVAATREGLDADEQLALAIITSITDLMRSGRPRYDAPADYSRVMAFVSVAWLFHENVMSRVVATALSSAAPGQSFVAHIHI